MPQQQGFTVVESLMALTLIGVGLAAWMGTATLAVAVAADADRASDGSYRARNRAEQLASRPCSSVVGGATAAEVWSVHQYPNGMRLVEVSAPYGSGVRAGTGTYAILVAC
ncbi:MAG: prepilin-type N-terminal cleavage/methylation domain-containing protein [Gemmatimonadaceae bacterium]|nr:prepilin-type N-terminal cleavage/methylation domain-containing protein [Gemmatimonadaceae bacterium]